MGVHQKGGVAQLTAPHRERGGRGAARFPSYTRTHRVSQAKRLQLFWVLSQGSGNSPPSSVRIHQ